MSLAKLQVPKDEYTKYILKTVNTGAKGGKYIHTGDRSTTDSVGIRAKNLSVAW